MAKMFNGCPRTTTGPSGELIECDKASHCHLEHVGYITVAGVRLRITWRDDWDSILREKFYARN